MTDITLIPTQELIAELSSRCSPSVFIGYKNEGNEGEQVFTHYTGNPLVCFGLCYQMALKIQVREISNSRERDD